MAVWAGRQLGLEMYLNATGADLGQASVCMAEAGVFAWRRRVCLHGGGGCVCMAEAGVFAWPCATD